MMTVKRAKLDAEAAAANRELVQTLIKVLTKQRLQLEDADEWVAQQHADLVKTENQLENLQERVDKMTRSHGVGSGGTTLEQLDRLSALLTARGDALEGVSAQNSELRAELENERMARRDDVARVEAGL